MTKGIKSPWAQQAQPPQAAKDIDGLRPQGQASGLRGRQYTLSVYLPASFTEAGKNAELAQHVVGEFLLELRDVPELLEELAAQKITFEKGLDPAVTLDFRHVQLWCAASSSNPTLAALLALDRLCTALVLAERRSQVVQAAMTRHRLTVMRNA